mmetsp:Transcript_40738/g.48914  ORF Transcript_40738/g.48914 Transcript_40738/m.48914 type:complete len:373 (+) Transcript_40738:854-1972(+)
MRCPTHPHRKPITTSRSPSRASPPCPPTNKSPSRSYDWRITPRTIAAHEMLKLPLLLRQGLGLERNPRDCSGQRLRLPRLGLRHPPPGLGLVLRRRLPPQECLVLLRLLPPDCSVLPHPLPDYSVLRLPLPPLVLLRHPRQGCSEHRQPLQRGCSELRLRQPQRPGLGLELRRLRLPPQEGLGLERLPLLRRLELPRRGDCLVVLHPLPCLEQPLQLQLQQDSLVLLLQPPPPIYLVLLLQLPQLVVACLVVHQHPLLEDCLVPHPPRLPRADYLVLLLSPPPQGLDSVLQQLPQPLDYLVHLLPLQTHSELLHRQPASLEHPLPHPPVMLPPHSHQPICYWHKNSLPWKNNGRNWPCWMCGRLVLPHIQNY